MKSLRAANAIKSIQMKGESMTEQSGGTSEEKKDYACEVCKSKYGHEQAKVLNWACCGHKMTRLETLYRSEPSPSGS